MWPEACPDWGNQPRPDAQAVQKLLPVIYQTRHAITRAREHRPLKSIRLGNDPALLWQKRLGTPWRYWLPPKRPPLIPPRFFLGKRTVLIVDRGRVSSLPTMATGNGHQCMTPLQPRESLFSLSGLYLGDRANAARAAGA